MPVPLAGVGWLDGLVYRGVVVVVVDVDVDVFFE